MKIHYQYKRHIIALILQLCFNIFTDINIHEDVNKQH